jgi:hypothetical protein
MSWGSLSYFLFHKSMLYILNTWSFAVLRCCAAEVHSWLVTLWDSLYVLSPKVKQSIQNDNRWMRHTEGKVRAVTSSQEKYGRQLGCWSVKSPQICWGEWKMFAEPNWLLYFPWEAITAHTMFYIIMHPPVLSILLGLPDPWRWDKQAVLEP